MRPQSIRPGSKRNKILVLTYWSYRDALIQTYTLPYVRMIADEIGEDGKVYLVTLDKEGRGYDGPIQDQWIIPLGFKYNPFGTAGVAMIIKMIWQLLRLIRTEHIDAIHAWCTPAGAVGYLLSMLSGKPLVVDSYEPHAEAMVENGTWQRGGKAFRILFDLEKRQTHRAEHLIAAAAGMRDYASNRYGYKGPMFVKPACVDLDKFSTSVRKDPQLVMELGLQGKRVAVYAGKFGGIYLDQEIFDLFRVARSIWGEEFHVLLLTPHSLEELRPFMHRAGTDEGMFTIRFVAHEDIPRYMGLGDLALTPVRPVPTKKYCSPIKNGEYWALGLPVIITPNISDDSRIIEEHAIGSVLQSLDDAGYELALREIDALLEKNDREQLSKRIRGVAEHYRNFEIAREVYRNIYGNKG